MNEQKPTAKEWEKFWDIYNKKHDLKPQQTELKLNVPKEQT